MNPDNTLYFKNGQLTLTDGRQDSLRQRLEIRLTTHKRTWFLNIDYGIDWFRDVLSDGVSKLTVDALLQANILLEEQVQKIIYFSSSIDPITGIYSCQFSVKLADNEVSPLIKLLANQSGLVVVDQNGRGIRVN